MLDILKNEKLWCAVAGAAAIVVGKKVLKSEKTRNLAVTGLAKGMKLQNDAKATFQISKQNLQVLIQVQKLHGNNTRGDRYYYSVALLSHFVTFRPIASPTKSL